MPKLAPGNYYMNEPKIGTGESKTGTPYIYIQGSITHASRGAGWEPVPTPTTRTVYLYLSSGAFPYTMDKLEATGWNGNFDLPGLTGDSVSGVPVECEHELYNGEQRERWNLPGGGGAAEHTTLTTDKLRMIKALAENRKRNGATPAPLPPPAPAAGPVPPTGDDIPFD